MPRDELGSAVDDKVRPELDGLLQTGRHHGAVHFHQGVLRVRHAADVRDVDDALHGISRALDHNQPGAVRDDGREVGGTRAARHVDVADLHVVARGHLMRSTRSSRG